MPSVPGTSRAQIVSRGIVWLRVDSGTSLPGPAGLGGRQPQGASGDWRARLLKARVILVEERGMTQSGGRRRRYEETRF